MVEQKRIIIFTRYPTPGETKTRLIPALGPEGAAQMQRTMTEHTVAVGRAARSLLPAALLVRYTGAKEETMRKWLGNDLDYAPQCSGDLGLRMQNALEEAFAEGAAKVVLVGIDCPDLDVDILKAAFEKLEERTVVFGPAEDGGYYLVGQRAFRPDVFDGIAWGTRKVFSQSMQRARDLHISTGVLPILRDIDRPEDLAP
jgi:hypothetical protein